jgi:hypothetical protein
MDPRLEGRGGVVACAGGGPGRVTALAHVDEGAAVALFGRDDHRPHAVASEIAARGRRTANVVAATSAADVDRTVGAVQHGGCIGSVFPDCGRTAPGRFNDADEPTANRPMKMRRSGMSMCSARPCQHSTPCACRSLWSRRARRNVRSRGRFVRIQHGLRFSQVPRRAYAIGKSRRVEGVERTPFPVPATHRSRSARKFVSRSCILASSRGRALGNHCDTGNDDVSSSSSGLHAEVKA